MSRVAVEFWSFVAYLLAAIVVVASVIVLYQFGTFQSEYSGEKYFNWPLIGGAIASALYSVLFAIMFSIVRHSYVRQISGDNTSR